MSTDRLFSEIYKQLDEKHREEIRPKLLNLLATSNPSERLLYKYTPTKYTTKKKANAAPRKNLCASGSCGCCPGCGMVRGSITPLSLRDHGTLCMGTGQFLRGTLWDLFIRLIFYNEVNFSKLP
jgi:hypothetical protein